MGFDINVHDQWTVEYWKASDVNRRRNAPKA
jgi:hypothetical protein